MDPVNNVYFNVISQEEFLSSNPEAISKFRSALKAGFFYLEMPESCKKTLASAEQFAQSFFNNEDAKTTKLSGFGGYHDRESQKSQVEAHYAERADWDKLIADGIYTSEQVELARRMNDLGLDILKKSLKMLEIPEEHWNKLTANLVKDAGTLHFTFNHYRPEVAHEGLPKHKDFGFVTVLFINERGLEGNIGGEWKDVPPLKDHFVINFGRCFEIITGSRGDVHAIEHRVRRVVKERISFGVFLDGNATLPLYGYDGQNITMKKETIGQYLAESFNEIY